MSAHLTRARDLVNQANAKMNKWFYPFGNKNEDALELLVKASNLFKIAKNYKEAGECFLRIVDCHKKLGSEYEVATSFVDAANMFRKISDPKTSNCLREAAVTYANIGKFSQAAKIEKELGEYFEENEKYDEALTHYQNAYDYFDGENQKTSANGCAVRKAHILALNEKYEDAVEAFEQAASNSLDDKLLKWGAKEYLFKATLCLLANMQIVSEEIDDVKSKFSEFNDMDIHFPDSMESKLCKNLIESFEQNDQKKFTLALRDYDNIKKLDNWQTDILTRIKDKMQNVQQEIPDLT